jgi:2-pyrone-4,6-dicarboxylate lactonase
MSTQDLLIQTYDPQPRAPRFELPALACDSHCHIFGPADRYPYAANRNFTPVDAPRERLFALHRLLGIGRCVIVQSAVHGHDNRVVEDAIAAGGGRYLGVALVPVEVSDAELARLARQGFRGVRFNFMRHLANSATPEQIVALTRRLEPLGMHLQVHFESSLIHELGPVFLQSATPVVIDHMGRVDASLGPAHADFEALRRLLDDPRFHVKVSGVDRISRRPPYDDGVVLAALLVRDHPAQCLWGTDWPHPNHHHVPSDAQLVDTLERIAPDAAALRALMVDNPARLYRFDESAAGVAS